MAEAVTICIPTLFDSRYIIELCLKSILKYTTYPDYKIIVCDAGVDEETNDYLSQLDFIKLIKATDWERPKDDLARAVDTEYYIIMHDDIRIFKYGWVQRRMDLMKKDPRNAIVGTAPNDKRFFPLGLLVKTDVASELGLVWGKQVEQGYDTGGLAYEKFAAQDKYKFVKYKFGTDIFHFAEMTWPKYKTEENYDKNKLGKLLTKRERNILKIREILENDAY